MEPSVTVYSTPTCPWCDKVKDYLKKKNVPFIEKDVSKDYNAAMEMVRRSGQQGVPVIATDSEVIIGFDPARLNRIAERIAEPKRPPLGLLAANADDYVPRHPELSIQYPNGISGIFVGEVKPASVAEQSGVRKGDIIQAVAGKRVRNMIALDQLIGTLKAGEKVSVRYVRDGEDHTSDFVF